MIVRNYAEHWIGCDICETVIELSRKTRNDPEKVLIMMQAMKVEHAGCERLKHDPRSAKLERRWQDLLREASPACTT